MCRSPSQSIACSALEVVPLASVRPRLGLESRFRDSTSSQRIMILPTTA